MFRIALCDDDKEILELVRENVAAYCTQKEIQAELITFDDSDLLADVIERKHIYDAYILDIEMQDYSGIELAAMIKERFCTSLYNPFNCLLQLCGLCLR